MNRVRRIAIISQHTLFAEGVLQKLKQLQIPHPVVMIDPVSTDYIAELEQQKVDLVLLNATEKDTMQDCVLCNLLMRFPDIHILRLDINRKGVQVVHSQHHEVESVSDILLLMDEMLVQNG